MQQLSYLFLLFCSLQTNANCIQDYYQLINQAELAICDNQLAKANKLYQTAFALECNLAFKADVQNALTLSCQLNDWESSQQYSTLLRAKDVPTKDLIKNNLNKAFPTHSYTFLEEVLVAPKYFLETADLVELRKLAQSVRESCPDEGVHCQEQIVFIDSLVFAEFKAILVDKTGWFPEVYLLERLESLLGEIENNWQWYWVQQLMAIAVQEGKLHSDSYLKHINGWYDNHPKLTQYGNRSWYLINNEPFLLKNISIEESHARNSIYLDFFDEEKKKLRFQIQHPEYQFSTTVQNSIDAPYEVGEAILKKGIFEAF